MDPEVYVHSQLVFKKFHRFSGDLLHVSCKTFFFYKSLSEKLFLLVLSDIW